MKHWLQLWFFIPHVVSAACFAGSFITMSILETNRSEPDHVFAAAGALILVAAAITSVVANVIGFRQDAGRFWPWLFAHIGAVLVPLYLLHRWIASHLA